MAEPHASLAAAHASFHDWMWHAALPFWATAGTDEEGRGFHESLALDGSPFGAPFKRVRVQARQVFVYSQAALLGWPGGLAAARRGYEFLRTHGQLHGGGWAKLLGPAGGVQDTSPDLYDLAFTILALSWFARASGEEEPLTLARRTADWVWTAMRAPEGGFENVLPADGSHRQQNPHMHLLEALLALHETQPEPVTASRAAAIVTLFANHFFHRESGTLGEFFDRSLAPAPGDAGSLVEPGHHYEWVWLLHQYGRVTGHVLGEEAGRLYTFANTHGPLPGTGLLLNAVDRQGQARDCGTRLWPLTEAIRAHVVMGEQAGRLDEALICRCVSALQTYYLDRTPRGTWIDTRDAEGRDAIGRVPGSSLYHIMGAYAELDRTLRG